MAFEKAQTALKLIAVERSVKGFAKMDMFG